MEKECCEKCIKHPKSDLVCKGFCHCHHVVEKDWKNDEKIVSITCEITKIVIEGKGYWTETLANYVSKLLEEERAIKFSNTYKSSQSYLRGFEDGKNEMRLKNAGLYRQFFGETGDRTFTSKELWELFNAYWPLFTPEQLKDIKNAVTDPFKK